MMVIGKTAQVLSCILNDIPLSRVTSCRDLGVTFNSNLNPSDHINDIVVGTHKNAGSESCPISCWPLTLATCDADAA